MSKEKYNLTFWQRLSLPFIWLLWAGADNEKRKDWHLVKKGMEKHTCQFITPIFYRGYQFYKCEHPGCDTCNPDEPQWTNDYVHKHNWVKTFIDAHGGQRYECSTCKSEGVEHSHHRYYMKVIKRSEIAKLLPHQHEWCFEYTAGREVGASSSTPMSEIYSCECGQFAVKHHKKDYQLLQS